MCRSKALVLALVAGSLMVAGTAVAQRRADSKITGEAYRLHSSQSYTRSARDSARVLYGYGRGMQEIPRELAEEHVAAIRQNVQSAGKQVAKVKAAHPQDKDVQRLAKKVEDHYAKVAMLCDMLDKTTSEAHADHVKLCDCCAGIHKELTAADKAHDELMHKLQVPKLDEVK